MWETNISNVLNETCTPGKVYVDTQGKRGIINYDFISLDMSCPLIHIYVEGQPKQYMYALPPNTESPETL